MPPGWTVRPRLATAGLRPVVSEPGLKGRADHERRDAAPPRRPKAAPLRSAPWRAAAATAAAAGALDAVFGQGGGAERAVGSAAAARQRPRPSRPRPSRTAWAVPAVPDCHRSQPQPAAPRAGAPFPTAARWRRRPVAADR